MFLTKKWWITSAAMALGLFLLITAAQAEQPYDITTCGSATNTVLFSSEDLTIISFESKGISISNHENKAFDNNTFQCAGVIQIASGKPSCDMFCIFLDPDGDVTLGESTLDGAEGTWKFIYGTGKWKGISGGGKN
ncbi:MAG: hypothetical protein WBN03_13725, partial [Desulfobacterales bacterium]